MKKVSKNLFKNLRISLNVYERQKYCTKKQKKKQKKHTTNTLYFIMNFALT